MPRSASADLRVTRVRQVATLINNEIRALVDLAARELAMPGTFEWLTERVWFDGVGFFVGFERRRPVALGLVLLPDSPFMLYPQVVVAFNDGPKELRRMVESRVRAWISDAGFDRALALNQRHPDGVFMRGLASFGRPRRVGSVIEFRF